MTESIGVHLHVHSHESQLDGLSSPTQLAEKAKELNMVALGLSDHGVMGGIPELAIACIERGIKPIPGCEIYTTENFRYKGEEIGNLRLQIIHKFKVYKYKKSGRSGQMEPSPKTKEMNQFITLCRRKSYNTRDTELIEEALELLKDSYLHQEISSEEELNKMAVGLIREVYSIMKYRSFHMLLLATTNQGLRNLQKITSVSHLEGFYSNPRIDLNYIKENDLGKDIVATTACLGSYFAQCILAGDEEEAIRFAYEAKSIFSYFYLEKQATRIPEQVYLNERIDIIAKEHGFEKVLTTDVHYARKENIEVHDMLVALSTGKCVTDPTRMKYEEEFWMKSDQEMLETCNDIEAWQNTKKIADLVDIDFSVTPQLPVYTDDETVDAKQLLNDMALSGLIERMKQEYFDLGTYIERLNYELDVINSMGFSDYFLVVQDYINATAEAGYPVGPGRGSAAGSLVCYALGITHIDPIKYDLIFERFLNPERIGLPDIDTDFSYDGSAFAFRHLQEKYGEDRVAQIGTKTTFAAKSACRDIGKVLKVKLDIKEEDIKSMMSLINESTLKKSLKASPELQKYIDKYPDYWEAMLEVEGKIKTTGVHAGGVILSKDSITNHMPLQRGVLGAASQYDMDDVEKRLVKFDVLKLKTLDVVHLAIKLANLEGKIDINKLSVDDPDVYREIYQKKILSGVFQVESDGMKNAIDEIKPSNFNDLSAIIALFRPGPLQFIPTYGRRKHKREAVSYPDDRLKDILEVTYGVWVVA